MIKHIGRHNNEKVVVVFNTLPSEDHMALVVYTGKLPSALHDEVIKVLESPVGQQAKELSEALHRNIGAEGSDTLSMLHRSGHLKKVPTNQIILTPNSRTSVRLDEVNKYLAEIAKGEDAVKRLQDLENSRGYADNKKIDQPRDLGEPNRPSVVDTQVTAPSDGVLTDEAIAQSRLAQASKYRAEADSLLTEAKRLEQEANDLLPKPVKPKTTKKAVTKSVAKEKV